MERKKETGKGITAISGGTGEPVCRGQNKTPYNYLYFPDDGENTYRHNGDQEFMRRGAEEATENIIDQCVSALVEEIGG